MQHRRTVSEGLRGQVLTHTAGLDLTPATPSFSATRSTSCDLRRRHVPPPGSTHMKEPIFLFHSGASIG
jgi:hypothetical protein